MSRAKGPFKNTIIYYLRGAKGTYGTKGPCVGQKAHAHLLPFCPYLGGNNNVITYNFFSVTCFKPKYFVINMRT